MQIRFHDYHPHLEALASGVLHGLERSPKRIHPKFFYDTRGSRLFDAICEQPEYYVPRVEREIVARHGDEIVAAVGPGRHIIEPGAGSGRKIRFLLERAEPAMFVPMDIAADHLRESAERLARDFPHIPIHAVCVDHTKPYELPADIPAHHRLFFYPGSSLGNFEPSEALGFLADLRAKAGDDGQLLIGIDKKKSADVLDRAYNDAAGVTAAFNLNLLHRMRDELGADLDLDGFSHNAFYNNAQGRIEMHLVSRRDQTLRINGHAFSFRSGETIHTECSYKYTVDEFRALASDAGWEPAHLWQDSEGWFAYHLMRAR